MRWWPRRRVYVDDLPKTHDARFLVLFFVMFVAALGGVYVVGYFTAGDKIPSRTTVAGVDVGSLSRAEAHDLLVDTFTDQLDEPLTVRVGDRELKLVPSQEGMSFDVDATLDDAMGGTDWNPQHMLKVVEGGGAVDPIFRADPVRLTAALQPLADRVEQKPIDATVSIESAKPVVSPGHPGARLDVGAAAERVVAALRDHASIVRVRLREVQPAVTASAAASFVADRVTPVLSGPVQVTVAGHAVRVTAMQLGPALRVHREGSGFELGMLPGVLWARTHSLVNAAPGRPVDARVVFQDGHPTVVPSRWGTTVAPDAWAKAVFAASQHEDRRATAAVTRAAPRLTTADAEALSITNEIAFATETAPARLAGALSVASHRLDSAVVLPGASFSYQHQVGGASGDTVLGPLGVATQAAAERAGMTITRWPAISPVGHDLAFRNSTNHAVFIRSWVAPHGRGKSAVFVQFWGTPRL